MGYNSSYRDSEKRITYNRGDVIWVTGRAYKTPKATEPLNEKGTWKYKFRSHFTDGTTNPACILVDTEKVQSYGYIKPEEITIGGTKDHYLVSYDSCGGAPTPADQRKYWDSTLTLSSEIPVKYGHIFKGWSNRAGGPVMYQPKDIYNRDENITLYAIWEEKPYSIVVFTSAATADNMPSSVKKYKGEELILPDQIPESYGLTFSYWATNSAGSGTAYYPGGKYNIDSNSAQKLWAIWEEKTYTVTFDAETNGGSGSIQKTYKHGEKVGKLPTATKENYKFIGWYTTKSGNGQKVTENFLIQKAITFYARYVADASIHKREGTRWIKGFPEVRKGGKWVKGYLHVRKGGKWIKGI